MQFTNVIEALADGISKVQSRNYLDAIQSFRVAFELESSNAKAVHGLAWTLFYTGYQQKENYLTGNSKLAVDILSKYLLTNNDSYITVAVLAVCLQCTGAQQEAEKLQERYLTEHPDNNDVTMLVAELVARPQDAMTILKIDSGSENDGNDTLHLNGTEVNHSAAISHEDRGQDENAVALNSIHGKSILYVDFGLSQNENKNSNNYAEFSRECVRYAVNCFCLAHISTDTSIKINPGYLAYLRMPCWTTRLNYLGSRFHEVKLIAQGFASDLGQLTDIHLADAVYVATALSRIMLGFAKCFEHKKEIVKNLNIFFELNYLPEKSMTGENLGFEHALYCYAVERVIDVFPKAKFVAKSDALAEQFRSLLAVDVESVGIIRTPIRNMKNSANKTVVSFPGFQTHSKGYHHVPEIVKKILKEIPNKIDINIHNGNKANTIYDLELQALSESNKNLILQHGPLTEEDYKIMIANSHIICLPYNPEVYSTVSSSVVHEAMVNACYAVVPRDSSLSKILTDFGIPFRQFAEWTPLSIYSEIIAAIDTYYSVKEVLNDCAKKILSQQSNKSALHYISKVISSQ